MDCNWELGSEFHWELISKDNLIKWPENSIFTSMGRSPVLMLWQSVGNANNKLHVPDYFCEEVINYWKKNGIQIEYYKDNPLNNAPNFESIDYSCGDFVLAVNYFGLRSGNTWKSWKERNTDVVLIEDHTHDPCSNWAQTSNADYAFSSLRKTLPVPDGAILWSPLNLILPLVNQEHESWGSHFKLSGMFIKDNYLTSGNALLKDVYRDFQLKGEKLLSEQPLCKISDISRSQIADGYPEQYRAIRNNNVSYFDSLVKEESDIRHLSVDIPEGGCPFGSIVLFKDSSTRNHVKSTLIDNNIYAPVHWSIESSDFHISKEISDRILTLPFDHRYGQNDIKKVFDCLKIGLDK